MPVIFTQVQDQEFARTELLTNIAYLKTNADKLSIKTKLHAYALVLDESKNTSKPRKTCGSLRRTVIRRITS